MTKPDCYKCKYRGTVPGSTHSSCRYPGNSTDIFDIFNPRNRENAMKLDIKAEITGITGGWFEWPVDFDPAWLISCNGFEPNEATK